MAEQRNERVQRISRGKTQSFRYLLSQREIWKNFEKLSKRDYARITVDDGRGETSERIPRWLDKERKDPTSFATRIAR